MRYDWTSLTNTLFSNMDSSVKPFDFIVGIIILGGFILGGAYLLEGTVRPTLQQHVMGVGYTK